MHACTILNLLHLAAETDKMVEDSGEFYDGEKEGGDLRNEQSHQQQKRPAEDDASGESKKPKLDGSS